MQSDSEPSETPEYTELQYCVTDIKIKLINYVEWDALPLLECFDEDQWISLLLKTKTSSNILLNRRKGSKKRH